MHFDEKNILFKIIGYCNFMGLSILVYWLIYYLIFRFPFRCHIRVLITYHMTSISNEIFEQAGGTEDLF